MTPALEWVSSDGSLIVAPRRKVKCCAHCHGPKDKPGQRYCRRCHAEYMREWRAAQPKPVRPPRRETVVKWSASRETLEVTE